MPGGLFALGTDGMGRSENRATLRRHFEVDAECITIAALYQLKKQGKCDGSVAKRGRTGRRSGRPSAVAEDRSGSDRRNESRPVCDSFPHQDQHDVLVSVHILVTFMANQIKLPNLGENIESGDVLSILVSEGDRSSRRIRT